MGGRAAVARPVRMARSYGLFDVVPGKFRVPLSTTAEDGAFRSRVFSAGQLPAAHQDLVVRQPTSQPEARRGVDTIEEKMGRGVEKRRG